MADGEVRMGWRANWLLIGQALLERGGPMTAGEVAAAIGRDQSNTRSAAQAMARAGLLEKRPCMRATGARGRRPGSEFWLREQRVGELERLLARRDAPGTLRQGQQLVFAEASDGLLELGDALDEAGFGARGRWAALCDGQPQECVMVFDGAGAVRAAVDLMGMLRAAEVRCRRVSVADLMPAHELTAWARETVHRARRLQMRRDARGA
jgi:hypothetical protein